MNVLAVVIIAAFFALFFIFVLRDLDELAHEQLLDELWDEEVGADGLLSRASSGVGADTLGGAA